MTVCAFVCCACFYVCERVSVFCCVFGVLVCVCVLCLCFVCCCLLSKFVFCLGYMCVVFCCVCVFCFKDTEINNDVCVCVLCLFSLSAFVCGLLSFVVLVCFCYCNYVFFGGRVFCLCFMIVLSFAVIECSCLRKLT